MNADARFEGMTLAKLDALEERLDEVLATVRQIEGRCLIEHAAHASLKAEVAALRERTRFVTRVVWSAAAWIIVTLAGVIFAALGWPR